MSNQGRKFIIGLTGNIATGKSAVLRMAAEKGALTLDAEFLPHVFDRFYRADAARSRPGGTGLGLAIASLLVELHGGRLEATSRPGVGSEFRVVLPTGALPRGGAAIERGGAGTG